MKADWIHSAALSISHAAVEQSSTKIAPVGSLLMLVRGMGLANGLQIGEVTAPVAFNQDIRALHPSRDLLIPRFLLLALRHAFLFGPDDDVLSSAAHGTLKIDSDALKRIRVPVPPLPEQRRIVGILDEAFAGIATARANAEKTLRNAREVFAGAVDGVFVELQRTEKPRPLSAVVDSISTGPFGSLLHKADYEEGGIPLVNPINIEGDQIVPDRRKAVGKETTQRLSRYVLQEGDVVTGRRGEIGRCAAVSAEQAGWICGTGSFFIRPGANVDGRFLTHLLRSKPYRSQLIGLSHRATMPSIGNDDLANLPVHIPNIYKQREVEVHLSTIASKCEHLATLYRQKLAALDALKKSLLHQAFSGMLTGESRAVLETVGR